MEIICLVSKIDYKELIDSVIDLIAKKDNVEIILIPHVMCKDFEVEDDFRTCENILSKFKKKDIFINTIDKYYREDEIKAIISGCDFFIGSRMHACIGAVSTLVPTVPIAYSRKFIGIWEKLNLDDCVADPRINTQKEILDIIGNKFDERARIKKVLESKIPEFKYEIKNMFNSL